MRKKRTLVPRSRESINRQLDATKDDGASMTMKGDFSINPKVQNVRFDRLRCYKAGRTVMRIWNMLDPENPGQALLDGRLSTQGLAGLGGMSISEPAYCVQYAGITKDTPGNWLKRPEDAEPCSYIVARTKASTCEGVPFWEEPYVKLYKTAKDAMKTGQFGHGGAWQATWNALMSGSSWALPAFRQKYFVVCSLYENGGSLDLTREHVEYKKGGKDVVKDIARNGVPLGEAADDPLIIVQLAISAGKKLLSLCTAEKQHWDGNEDVNPSVMFRYGDPCGRFDAKTGTVKGGVFFTLYNPEKVTIEKNTTFKGIANPAAVEYEAAVSKNYQGPNGVLTADLSKEQVDNILSKHLFFWRESPTDPEDSFLLHEPGIEERCVLLAKAFRVVPQLLRFAWMSNPEYLKFDSVKSILQNRTTVAKPDLDEGAEEEEEEEEEPEAAVEATGKKAGKKSDKKAAKKESKSSAAALMDEFDEDELDEDELEDEEGDEDGEDEDDEESEDFDEDEESEDDDFDDEESEDEEAEDDDFDDEESDDEESEDEESEDEESEDDDFDDEEEKPVKGKGKAAAGKSGKPKSKPADAIPFDDQPEESGDSDDFDDEADNSAVETELNEHLSAAKAIARSSKRKSTPAAAPKAATKAAPKAPTKGKKKK